MIQGEAVGKVGATTGASVGFLDTVGLADRAADTDGDADKI